MSRRRYEEFWTSSETFHRNVGQIVVDFEGILACINDAAIYMTSPIGSPPYHNADEMESFVWTGWRAIVEMIDELPTSRDYGTFLHSRINVARKVRNFVAHASLVGLDETDPTRPLVHLRTSGLTRNRKKQTDVVKVPLDEISEAAGFLATLRDLCDEIYDHLYDCGYSIDSAFNDLLVGDPEFFVKEFLHKSEWLNARMVPSLLARVEAFEPKSQHLVPRDFLIEMIERESRETD